LERGRWSCCDDCGILRPGSEIVRFLICLSVALLTASGALAQRGGAGFGGGGRVAPNPGMPGMSPIPFVRPIPPAGMIPPGFGSGRALRPSGAVFGPYVSGGYGLTDGYGVSPSLQNVILLQSAPEAIPVAPPKPIQSMIWEAPAQPNAERPVVEDPPAFAIALKNRTTISAAAVWVQGNDVHYVDADGAHKQVALDAIDRDATRQLNRTRNLVLRLPPSQ